MTAMAGSSAEPALAGRSFPLGVLARAARTALPIGLVVSSLLLYLTVLIGSSHQDLDTYLAAGRDLTAGRPIYAAFLQHPFPDPTLRPAYIYPPVFTLFIVPLTWVPAAAAAWAWRLAMQAALVVAMVVFLRYVRGAWPVVWVGLLLTFSFYPLLVDVTEGQANLLVLALLVLGVVGILQGQSAAGAWLGAAAALKLTPLLLLGWLIVTRRWRAAGFLGLGFLGVTAVGAVIRPADSLTFVTQVLPALGHGTAYYSNQSLYGVLGRLLTANPYTNPWLAFPWEAGLAAAAGALLLGSWAVSAQKLDPAAAAFAFLPLLPLLSTVTWEHHLVVLLPVIWLIVARLAARGWPAAETALLAVAVVCLNGLPRWHPGPAFGSPGFRAAQTGDPLVLLSANALFFGTLVLFLGSRWLLRSR